MLTGLMAGLAAGALWGLVFVAPRMTPGLSAVDLTAGRFISFGGMAALAMLAMLVTWRRHTWPTARQAVTARTGNGAGSIRTRPAPSDEAGRAVPR